MSSTVNAKQAATVTGSQELDMAALLQAQKQAFLANSYPSQQERVRNLDTLCRGLIDKKEAFVQSMSEDFGGRNRHESLITDIFMVVASLKHAKKELGNWMKPRKREVSILLGTGRAYVLPQPVGVVGIVSPWNFPVNLSLNPLVAALAAGNRAIIKPSELTPVTSQLLRTMLSELFAQDHVAVVTGDAEVGKAFVHLPFDHLLFTGSTEVGKYVMRAAADNLTPVTLELGGKSPALVAPDADVKEAAIDIAYGKSLNAGQICIAPDYALVPREKVIPFLDALKQAVATYYPEGACTSPNFTSVINERHRSRIAKYIEEAKERNVEVVPLSQPKDGADEKLGPIAIVNPPEDLAVSKDEIFGPILLVKPYESLDEAVDYINARPRPLALYLFSKSQKVVNDLLKRTISGGVSVNDVIMHNAVDDLPFGGIGASGIGHYHGREGFDTFSKLRPVFERIGPRTDRMLRPPFKQLHDLILSLIVTP